MNSKSLRRLASDHAALHRAELPPYYLWPDSARSGMADDLTQLNILLVGPQGTPYSEGIWRLQLRIPSDYPNSPPKAFFRTKIWHPNVEESTGAVCLDTLKRDWQPKLTLRDILITISCLLINPNPDSALNSEAGKLVQEDWQHFAQRAKLMATCHAKIPNSLRDAAEVARKRGEETTADEDEESEYEEENTKENDPSLSPSPVEPSPTSSIRRPTVLGKRPLGDLPTPPEPPSDDECDDGQQLSCSARNIAANTPNLSSNMACMDITPALGERSIGINNFNNQNQPSYSVGGSSATIQVALNSSRASNSTTTMNLTSCSSEISTTFHQLSSSNKRMCSIIEGKENQAEAEQQQHLAQMLAAQVKSVPLVGLGVKGHHTGGAALSSASSKKGCSSAGIVKPKARTGLRRL